MRDSWSCGHQKLTGGKTFAQPAHHRRAGWTLRGNSLSADADGLQNDGRRALDTVQRTRERFAVASVQQDVVP